jgi:hypothetical protein
MVLEMPSMGKHFVKLYLVILSPGKCGKVEEPMTKNVL